MIVASMEIFKGEFMKKKKVFLVGSRRQRNSAESNFISFSLQCIPKTLRHVVFFFSQRRRPILAPV